MNSLTWAIYAIHVVDVARIVANGVLFAGIGAIVLMTIGMFILGGELYTSDDTGPWAKKWTRRAQIAVVVSLPLLVIIPSRQTLLLMAGSEIGDRIVASEAVRSIADPGAELLREWIKSETDRLRAKK